MKKRLITIFCLLLFSIGYSQKIEDLKKKSDSHNNGSNGKSENGGSNNNISSEPGCMDDCISGCVSSLFNDMIQNRQDNRNARNLEKQRIADQQNNSTGSSRGATNNITIDEPILPFESMNLSFRGSFYPANYQTWVPEITFSRHRFSYSARYMAIAEKRLDKTEHYATFDFQPLQVNFINEQKILIKMGLGGMLETYSGQLYFEMTTNANWRMAKKMDMGVEGRLGLDQGIVRQEASIHLNYAIWEHDNRNLLIGIQAMLSQYYQSVNVNTIGMALGFRF